MYKLGPVHQGIFERGVKTGSDSYVMLEAKAGAFSLVMGSHKNHFDTSDFPFSYILDVENKSILVPAANLQTVGTLRDSQKWPQRDKRKGEKLDAITFDLFNPYIIQKVQKAISILKKFSEKTSEYHLYKNVRIKHIFIPKAIKQYQTAIDYYLGEKILNKIITDGFNPNLWKPENEFGSNDWIDLGGLILPKEIVIPLEISSVEKLLSHFNKLHKNYANFEWNYICKLIEKQYGIAISSIKKEHIVAIFNKYKESLSAITAATIADADNEFNASSMIGFGISEEEKEADFIHVRGTLQDNSFVRELDEKYNHQLMRIEKALGLI
jgi:hypothetical protein